MKEFFLFIALLPVFLESHSQTGQDLVGNWYAKPYAHPRNLAKATLYIRKILPDAKESLSIDSSFHYTYKQWYAADTLINKGAIVIQGDTLFFFQSRSTSKNMRPQDTIKLFLYYAGSAQLIYSYYQLPKRVNKSTTASGKGDSSHVFTPVESAPEYKLGANAFYKTIYQQLAKSIEQPTASTLMEFRIIIDTTGNMEAKSVEARNEFSKQYLPVVAEALKKLEGNFSPGVQNGRTVRSYYTFQINY